MGTLDTSAEERTVLFVDPGSDRSPTWDAEMTVPFQVRVEPDLERARTELASAGVDCLVFTPDALSASERQAFVDDARTIAPNCPIVLFTANGPEAFAKTLLAQTATVVERSPDPDNWGFLVEKVQSTLGECDCEHHHEEMFRTLVETARDGLYRLDSYGNVVYANQSWADMLGYERAELLGSHASRTMAEGELERGQALIQAVLEDDDRKSDIVDVEMNTKSGERITVAVHFVVLTTESGAYDGVMGVVRDVTERRETERELERKNERLNQLVSTVSHDLRNPLNVAQGRMTLARAECDCEHLAPVDRALERMDDLIEDLLTLAREGTVVGEMERVDLAAVVEESWRHVRTAEATLEVRTAREVRADRSRLLHLFENLFRNAIEHAGHDVTVTVGDLSDGFYVADDGPGIPEEDREAVFEDGYSTSGDGTGFGLSIVEEVAEAHDWAVSLGDAEGGARFEITGVEFVAT